MRKASQPGRSFLIIRARPFIIGFSQRDVVAFSNSDKSGDVLQQMVAVNAANHRAVRDQPISWTGYPDSRPKRSQHAGCITARQWVSNTAGRRRTTLVNRA